MNFLALCQRAVTECGVASGLAVASALPTVVGVTGSIARVVNWVGDAWNDIQIAHDDWDFLRSSNVLGAGASFATIAGQASYPLGVFPTTVGAPGTVGIAPDSFGKWDRETFRNFVTAEGYLSENYLDEIPFDVWRDSYMYGAMRSEQTRPVVVAVGPDQSVCLGPPPDGNYTITADYFMAPSVMALDTDLPIGLPTKFHMLIVYRAMTKYGQYEAAQEVLERGQQEYAPMYSRLLAVRAPRMSFSGSLA